MDVGAARPDLNVLGLEIRDPVVEKALRVRDERGLRNVHFVACSANANIDQVRAPPRRSAFGGGRGDGPIVPPRCACTALSKPQVGVEPPFGVNFGTAGFVVQNGGLGVCRA